MSAPVSAPTKRVIHFVRHAEGEHNVAGQVPGGYLREDLEDAVLTDFGHNQCQDLHSKIFHWHVPTAAEEQAEAAAADTDMHLRQHPYHPARAELLVVSPLNRALQTASKSFEWLNGRIPWLALECIRETSGLHPCDRRKHISHHTEGYPHVSFDHIENADDLLYPQYTDKREPMESVISRGNEFIEWLKGRDEENIIVVTHSSFLKYFFIGCGGVPTDDFVWFENCELRSFHFSQEGESIVFEPIVSVSTSESDDHKTWL
jgi:broad specificity phosphatase PhoE